MKLTPKKALQRARDYCAKQERCHQQVRDKLYQWGLHRNEVESAIAELVTGNFLNEERYARAFASGHFRLKYWGRFKIAWELKLRKVSDACIRKGLEEITEEEYRATLRQLAREKLRTAKAPNPYALRNKVAMYLIGKGYEPELVWSVLKE